MLSNNRVVLFLLCFIVFLLLICGGYFLYRGQTSSNLSTNLTDTSVPRSVPTGFVNNINSIFKVLSKDPQDQVGRTVIYDSNNKYIYNKSGKFSVPNFRTYFIGVFNGWRSIPNSNDKEMILLDPTDKTELGNFRVVFEPNPQFSGVSKTTRLSVENLQKAESVAADEGTEDYDVWTESLSSISKSDLDELIQIGDVLVLFPLQTRYSSEWTTLEDQNGRSLTDIVLLRRNKGAVDINR